MADALVVLAPLIPPDPGGDPQPCQASFQTQGMVDGREMDVRVMDLGIAAHGLENGGWAADALDEVLASAETVVIPSGSDVLEAALKARGLSTSEQRVSIADYGPLTGGMALNGIEILPEMSGPLHHPGVVGLEGCGTDLGDVLLDRWTHLSGVVGGLDVRAYRVRWSIPDARFALTELMRRLDHHRACGRIPSVAFEGPGLPAGLHADPAGLAVLAGHWEEHWEVHRALDDITRRAHFSWLVDVRGRDEASAMAGTQAALGSPTAWGPAFKRYAESRVPRVVVVPTWQCELRCRYCTIPKQGGRVMTPEVLEGALELLLSADGDRYALHFFGGEPFLEWDLIQQAIRTGEHRAPGRIQYRFTTNGWAVTPQRLEWLSDFDVHLQLSLDGDAATQNSARRSLDRDADSYANSPASLAEAVQSLDLAHDLIQVVHPSNAAQADHNFQHLIDLGYQRIQLNYALGSRWSEEARTDFADALHRLGNDLRDRWASGQQVQMVNLEESRMRIRTNREITVDWDGTVMSSNGFLYVPDNREHYMLGHLDDGHCFDRYVMDGPSPEQLLEWWYPEEITRNNQSVGAILMSFVQWMTAPPTPDA